ncbi:MAG: hypothetical protein GVY26_14840 [Bacteroidetes bacterium]|jgi:HSP20 family molecular chaperone IbpA|nr:hypothetical protein [Bacteroidota bacterium]
MFSKRVLAVALILLPGLLAAQASLLDSLNALSSLLQDVKVKKDEYFQELTFDQQAPYRLQLTITEVDRKGREEQVRYDFNLGLMSPKRVRYEDGRNRIIVSVESAGGSAVKEYEDGEFEGYDENAYFMAANIDNARDIRRTLKAMIPLAKEQWEADNALPEDYEGLSAWIQEAVRNITVEDETWDQKWMPDPDSPNRVTLEQIEDGEEAFRYYWNMADVNPSSVDVDARGKTVTVEMGMKDRRDFVRVEEEGVLDDYESSVSLQFAEIDEAQLAANTLRRLAKLAAEMEDANPIAYESRAEARKAMAETLTNFKRGEESISQRISGECQMTYERVVEEEGEEEAYLYAFDFADLNPRSVEIDVKRDELYVVADLKGGKDYVYTEENGEQEDYEDEVSFAVEDIPKAKRVRQQIIKMAEECPDETAVQDLAWMQEALQSIDEDKEELSQSLSLMQGDPCKWVFTRFEEGRNDTDELRYEFNLYDLDDSDIELNISGTTVTVGIPTVKDEEIIKLYTNDEEVEYEDELEFVLKDIADGKAFMASLKAMIEACNE